VASPKSYSFKSPGPLGVWVRLLIGARGAWILVSAFLAYSTMRSGSFVFVFVRGETSRSPRFSAAPALVSALALLLHLAAIVVWLLWQERVTENVWSQGQRIKTTPGWAVGWWFIPVANLWMPAVSVYRVAKASAPRDASIGLLVGSWWAAFTVLPVALYSVAVALAVGPAIDALRVASDTQSSTTMVLDLTRAIHLLAPWWLAASLMSIPAAILAIAMVSRIDDAQETVGPLIPARPDLGF
jgi:hypothetical protein